jgi:hypothetical protein
MLVTTLPRAPGRLRTLGDVRLDTFKGCRIGKAPLAPHWRPIGGGPSAAAHRRRPIGGGSIGLSP